jgi:tetratricopeptide (TPR) repeat protein
MASDAEVDESLSYARGTAATGGFTAGPSDVASIRERQAKALDEQIEVLRLQNQHLAMQISDAKREDRVRYRSLRVRHVNDLLKMAFGVSGAVVVTAFAIGIIALVWSAHEATGLVIQPLKAPPDFAERGLDGTVLAQRLLDKLNGYVTAADKWSFRAADNVSGNWGNDSKVQIPDTGVSVFELTRFLRQALGHETSMSGEVYRTAHGIALTVRVGTNPGTTFEGQETDIDLLLSRGAQEMLKETQPYRYVWALYSGGMPASDVAPIAEDLVASASGEERSWRGSALDEMVEFGGDFHRGMALARSTVAAAPGNPSGYIDLAPAEWALGHLEGALVHIETAERLLASGSQADFEPSAIPFLIANCRSFAADVRGAYSDAVIADIAESKTGTFDFDLSGPGTLANDLALDHDPRAALAVLSQHPKLSDDMLLRPKYVTTTGPVMPNFFLHAAESNWADARTIIAGTDAVLARRSDIGDVRHTFVWPWLAYALAQTGELPEARALIAKTPLDCTLCLEMRGRVAEASGDRVEAMKWYERAIRDAPSIPFSYTDLGTMLLRHGDLDGAIAQFKSAKLKSPHYADALELWGEALTQKNRSDLALAKFAEANRYAANWGRLHLKWGEALSYTGRNADARLHFDAATGMNLSADDRAALAKLAGPTHG